MFINQTESNEFLQSLKHHINVWVFLVYEMIAHNLLFIKG